MDEWSVCQFFDDDNEKYAYMRRYVSLAEAVAAYEHYTTNVAAKMGLTKRVIITDGGDCIAREWKHGVVTHDVIEIR